MSDKPVHRYYRDSECIATEHADGSISLEGVAPSQEPVLTINEVNEWGSEVFATVEPPTELQVGQKLYTRPAPSQEPDFTKIKREAAAPTAPSECVLYGIVYEYDSPYGVHKSFQHVQRNGRYPDRTVEVFTTPPDAAAQIADLQNQYDLVTTELRGKIAKLQAAARMALEMIETNAHERRHVRWKLREALGERHE